MVSSNVSAICWMLLDSAPTVITPTLLWGHAPQFDYH